MVQVFFDTTVLVAASERSHPHHARALPALRRVVAGQDTGFVSAHSIAETYAALTRIPVQPRIHPSEAARIIMENIVPYCTVVPLTHEEYLQALTVVRDAGISGAKIYDALLLACATKCAAERIYTFNLGDFRQLATADQLPKVMAP